MSNSILISIFNFIPGKQAEVSKPEEIEETKRYSQCIMMENPKEGKD